MFSAQEKLAKLIARHGRKCVLEGRHGRAEIRAFFTPLRYKNRVYLEGTYSPIGYFGKAYYEWFARNIGFAIEPNDELTCENGDRFLVKWVDTYHLGEAPLYLSGILQKCEDAPPEEG